MTKILLRFLLPARLLPPPTTKPEKPPRTGFEIVASDPGRHWMVLR